MCNDYDRNSVYEKWGFRRNDREIHEEFSNREMEGSLVRALMNDFVGKENWNPELITLHG